MAKSALDFATEIEKALASGSWRHTELANRIEMYVETRLEARALERGGEMLADEARVWEALNVGLDMAKSMRLPGTGDFYGPEDWEHAKAGFKRLLARESTEPAEERETLAEIIAHEIEALAEDPAGGNVYAEGYNDALPDCIRIVHCVCARDFLARQNKCAAAAARIKERRP